MSLIWKNSPHLWTTQLRWVFLSIYKREQWSGGTYIVILVFIAVIIADHWLGLPSALPLLAFVLAARLLTELDLNSHRLGWWCTREEEEGVTAFYSCWIAFLQQNTGALLALSTFMLISLVPEETAEEHMKSTCWANTSAQTLFTTSHCDQVFHTFMGNSFHLKESSSKSQNVPSLVPELYLQPLKFTQHSIGEVFNPNPTWPITP